MFFGTYGAQTFWHVLHVNFFWKYGTSIFLARVASRASRARKKFLNVGYLHFAKILVLLDTYGTPKCFTSFPCSLTDYEVDKSLVQMF